MNHCYRLVFNKSTQVWQVACEMAKSHSKSAAVVLLPLLSLLSSSYAWAEPVTNALPTGGQVISGQSVITQSGNQLNIVQSSQKAIINWQNYNIGSNAEVNYVQNNASAISLNRVTTGDPSAIFGKLNANGQVWLINPNGILFGKGAQVNVGGLLASTLNIADDDFISGKYQFTGSNGSVVNMGAISTNQGGYVAMLAAEVRNEGVISAMQGTVAMAAGNTMTLDFNGNGLINVQVDSASVNTLVENRHLIQVGNGQVLMSTKAANGLITSVINNTGKIEANSMVNDGGVIRLTGAKTVLNSGEISATSASLKGGTVHLLGDNVGMFSASSINVSGKTGGGTILVGGDYQGKNVNLQNASKTFVHQDAKLIADATENGDGGTVIVWADDITRYYGSVSAKGGAVAGNGGFVEVSGKRLLNFFGSVDLSASNGAGGNLLLDPTNIILSNGAAANTSGFTANTDNTEAFADDAGMDSIFNVGAASSFSGIAAGSTITLQATNDITVADAFNVATATGTANNSLTLEANNNININNTLTLDGTGALTLRADADNNGVGALAIGAAITTDIGGANLFGANVTSTTAGVINTTGTANTGSGNVNITASDSINLAANVITSGASSAGNNGQNAGNISLIAGKSINATGTAAFAAGGGDAGSGGGNLNGGNAGSVSLAANTGINIFSVQASGGVSSGVTGNSGNGGNITISNQVSGDIEVRSNLVSRAGNVSGSGNGGIAGAITINNEADAGNVNAVVISTGDRINSNGGNVLITSKAGVSVTSNIGTSGGSSTAGNAGRNAGNITIIGATRNITGTITANGSAGNGTNLAGGNAGVVSIKGSGTLTTAAINVKTGNATGTGAGGLAGSVTLSGRHVDSTAIDTSAGVNGLGGNVNITTTDIAGTSSITSINAANSGAINLNVADTLTVTGIIAGANTTLAQSGLGKTILAGTNTYTGLTSIATNSTLQIGDGTINGSIDIAGGIANSGTIIFNQSGAHSYGGAVSGAGAVEKDGAGEFTFTGGGKTYTGATNIKAGIFKSNSAITNASAVSILAGATLDLNNRNEIVGSIAGGGQIIMGTANLTSGGDNTSTIFSGNISGTGGNFNKAGTGTLTLSGNNTYTGVTTVQDGTLSAASANALGDIAGSTVVANGKTLNINNATLAAETITLENNAVLNGTDAATVTGDVSTGNNSKIGTTSFTSTLTIGGVLSSATGDTLEIIGAGSVVAINALNNVDIVKITNAGNVNLRDVDSIRFATAASTLSGNLTVNATDNITLDGTVTSTTANILLSSNAFVNNTGANALTASAGRWVVHTANLAGSTYGGLASGNQAIYARALGTATTETGNRYVFVQSPTLNVTSTNQTKTYGQIATAAVANAYTATTFVDASAYGDVFTQDTVANSLTGSATSAGSAATVNVGSYAIDVAPITPTNGYALNKSNAGNLSVTAATLNFNAVTDTKIYDGNTDSDGIVTTSGLVNGNTVTNLTQSYATKNVMGSDGSTLNVNAGYNVNDGNSGNNYRVNTNSAMGSINPANLSITANNATKVAGNVNPAFSSTITGFVSGETDAVLIGTLDYNTLADTNSPAGNYEITPFGVSAGNYAIAFNDGTLSVTVVPVLDSANAGTEISTFNNATTRPEQAVQSCNSQSGNQAMINGLDEFGVDDVDYRSSISQPQVGGVIANALAGASCSTL